MLIVKYIYEWFPFKTDPFITDHS